MDGEKTFERIAAALREALGPSAYENYILLLLFLPAVAGLIYVLLPRKIEDPNSPTQDELDFFEIARLQMGLEEFDRDLLIEVAETCKIKPVYKPLLEEKYFVMMLRKIENSTPDNEKLEHLIHFLGHLKKLRKKLFPERISETRDVRLPGR